MSCASLVFRGVVVAFLSGCIGCVSSHRVINTGDSMLYSVKIESGGQEFDHGYLGSKCCATYSGSMRIARQPAPILSWKTTEHGAPISQAVQLEAEPGGREVVFEIDGKTAKGRVDTR